MVCCTHSSGARYHVGRINKPLSAASNENTLSAYILYNFNMIKHSNYDAAPLDILRNRLVCISFGDEVMMHDMSQNMNQKLFSALIIAIYKDLTVKHKVVDRTRIHDLLADLKIAVSIFVHYPYSTVS